MSRVRNKLLWLIIECFGDYWHCNPKQYDENFILHIKKTAKEIWKVDEERIKNLNIVKDITKIIWEHDWKNNKENILKQLEYLINGVTV